MIIELDEPVIAHREVRRLRSAAKGLKRGEWLTVRAAAKTGAGEHVRPLLQMAGLLVGSITAEGSGLVLIKARPVPEPPASFAAAAWGEEQSAVKLDLRYAPDEAEWLDPDPRLAWIDAVASKDSGGAEFLAHYPVDDPFGAQRSFQAVSQFFDCSLEASQITFASGVTSLLLDLCGLADGGPVACPPLVHTDLEARAFALGHAIHVVPDPSDADDLMDALAISRPALLHLDRPTFTGHVTSLETVERISNAAAAVGAPLVIDEAGATYIEPAGSAVTLVNQVKNLVVLRGFTKAYSWGGLRAGFAVSSREAAADVRRLVAPMQVSQPALAAATCLLKQGDRLAPLRQQIRSMKARTASLLASYGLQLLQGHADLPWIAISDHDQAVSALFDRCGIRPLQPTMHPAVACKSPPIRITVPLSEARYTLLADLISSDGQMKSSQRLKASSW